MSFRELPLLKEKNGTVLFYPYIPKSSFKVVKKVLSGRWIGQGPKVEEFEKKFNIRVEDMKKGMYAPMEVYDIDKMVSEDEIDFDLIPGKTIDYGQVKYMVNDFPIPSYPERIEINMNGFTDPTRFDVMVYFGTNYS
jgi:hypothetical protein